MDDQASRRDQPDEAAYPDDAPTMSEGDGESGDEPTVAEGTPGSEDDPRVPRVPSSDPDSAPTLAEGDLVSEGWYASKVTDPVVVGKLEEAKYLPREETARKVVSEDEPTQYPVGSEATLAEGAPRDPEIVVPHGGARGDEARNLPKSIGGYQITRILGTGGMSVVYAALQKQPRRPVALKVMKSDISADRAIHRFKREVEILGRLNHPCIAQVFDAGTHDDGSGAGERGHSCCAQC